VVPFAAEVLTVPAQIPDHRPAAATVAAVSAVAPPRPAVRASTAPIPANPRQFINRPASGYANQSPRRGPERLRPLAPSDAVHQGATATLQAPAAPMSVAASSPVAAPTGRVPMRTRRLMADARQMAHAFASFPLIRVWPLAGDPPEKYHVEYGIQGLERGKSKGGRVVPVVRERHVVEIQLTSDYPRQAPHCKMLTPVFHPNIDPSTICVGDHWTAGERLVDLVVRIGEMIAYQAYNIKSPLDAEAAMWADLNGAKLPIDGRSLRPAELE
jgi:ubiquitin-protein ligase